MSTVSVVIPCYRYGHFLEAAVASVLRDQPGVDVRVLIIDDASPDDSPEVATSIADREPRVEVALHRRNRGNIATFNEGLLDWADGDYTLLLSADDRATPGALRRASDLLDAHPSVGFAYGHALWVNDGTPLPQPRTKVRGWTIQSGAAWLRRRFEQAENPISTPSIVVRTSSQKRAGGYDPSLPKAADMEMFMRLAEQNDVGYIRGADQAFYRLHGDNMSKGVDLLADLQQRKDVFGTVLDRQHRRGGKDVAVLNAVVHKQLAKEAVWAAAQIRGYPLFGVPRVTQKLLAAGNGQPAGEVSALLDFAVGCWPGVVHLPAYRAIEEERPVGPRELAYMLDQKSRWWLRRRGWKYLGR